MNMKKYNIYYQILPALILVIFFACKKNKVENRGLFITNAAESVQGFVSVDDKGGSISLTSSSYAITQENINISYVSDTNVVANFNKKHKTKYKALPSRFYSLSAGTAVIPAGASVSNAIKVTISPLDATIKDGDLYMVPVEIKDASSNIPVIEASRILYIVINRVLINPALDAGHTGVTFAVPDPIKDLSQFTVEMRVRVTTTFRNNMALFYAYPSEIYSRFGDVVIKPNQLQVKYAGVQPASSTEFLSNKWYHIAYVFDGNTNSFKIYVDGKLDGTTTAPGNTKFNLESMGFAGAAQVQELRFWTKVLTQAEISSGMCAVNPASDGLYGYWKFNEGTGNTVADATGHGHTGTIGGTARWVTGIRCPD